MICYKVKNPVKMNYYVKLSKVRGNIMYPISSDDTTYCQGKMLRFLWGPIILESCDNIFIIENMIRLGINLLGSVLFRIPYR